MRQGRASRDNNDGRKVEPRPRAIVPAGVAEIGIAQGNHVTDHGSTGYGGVNMYGGRGFKSPRDRSVEIHRGGSQGKR